MMAKRLFTSESVTEGHPDKICDQISDAVLDAILAQDPQARVACETTVTTGLVHVMGEITTSCYVDIPKTVREVVRDIGYDRAKFGFDCDTCAVITSIDEQSPDIAMGVDKTGGHRGLAGHAGLGVLSQDCVQHCVRDLVADFVGMPLGHGFGSKKSFCHCCFSFLVFGVRKNAPRSAERYCRCTLISRYTTAGFGTFPRGVGCRGFIGPVPQPLLIRLLSYRTVL